MKLVKCYICNIDCAIYHVFQREIFCALTSQNVCLLSLTAKLFLVKMLRIDFNGKMFLCIVLNGMTFRLLFSQNVLSVYYDGKMFLVVTAHFFIFFIVGFDDSS